jgi:PilZ domain-containing protein
MNILEKNKINTRNPHFQVNNHYCIKPMARKNSTSRHMDENFQRCNGELILVNDPVTLKEKRRHQRFTPDVLCMYGKAAYTKIVKIIDISASGILIKTCERLDASNLCILKIKGKGIALNIKSIVAWCLFDGSIEIGGNSVRIYRAGLMFMDVSEEKKREILRFIDSHKQEVDKEIDIFDASGTRLNTRFQIKTPEKAALVCRKDYKIKNLSLGGMLIEIGDALDIGEKLSLEISRSREKFIKVLGRVISCIPIKESDYAHYDTGIEFFEMSEQDGETLKEVICLLENMGFIAT